MDCGPATLKALLEGYGVRTSYGRLREACQTSVDGTSIDTLEELAVKLGLEAEQVMVPLDHFLLPETHALPAIVMTMLPNSSTHYVLLWRRHGSWLQIMDPTIGRRWARIKDFLSEAYVHEFAVPAADWRLWAGEDEFGGGLTRRLRQLGVSKSGASSLIREACEDEGWESIAALDATTRMVNALVEAGGISRGSQAARMLDSVDSTAIPEAYWSVRRLAPDAEGNAQLMLRGVPLVRVLGPRQGPKDGELRDELSAELAAVVDEPDNTPGRQLFQFLRPDGFLTPSILIGALAVAAGGVLLEALLFRALLEMGDDLTLVWQRLGGLAAVLILGLALLLLETPTSLGLWRLGRRLEVRLRMAFLEKIPRLGDRYFASRLSSDMAERSHSIHQIRNVGPLVGALLRTLFELVFITIGIAWLDPSSGLFAVGAAVGAVLVPILAHRGLAERDLRVRSHAGALSRFYLDSLVGLMPIRAHTAEDTMRREHESLLSEWSRAGFRLQTRTVAMLGWQLFLGFSLAVWLVVSNLRATEGSTVVLLLVFWALSLPILGQQIAMLWSRYPWQRNVALRLLEPLGAVEGDGQDDLDATPPPVVFDSSPAISLRDVRVVAGGHLLLDGVNADIEAGSHVAVVGSSGAGKSTLVGLLLGWHRPAHGEVLIDGEPLTAQRLEGLRNATAWVDPAVRLWNRTLMDNLTYGNEDQNLGSVIDEAMLEEVLRTLPDGLQTTLGEGGCLVSGGEGQRVRLARAMMRKSARLVILDEPFRGLERRVRTTLLDRSRKMWSEATLIYVSHDLSQTLGFDRVLVVERGRVIEQGRPSDLVADPASRYSALLEMERVVQERVWASTQWRRLRLEDGRLHEELTEEPIA